MPIIMNTKIFSPHLLGCYLKALHRIGDFELRQATFFSNKLPEKRYRDDFQTLLLLLLACLSEGHPRAGIDELVGCITTDIEKEVILEAITDDGLEAELSSVLTDSYPADITNALFSWFDLVTSNETLEQMKPLLAFSPPPLSKYQPLVIYDSEQKSFYFQAYYKARLTLAERIPVLLKTQPSPLDVDAAAGVIKKALNHCFKHHTADFRQAAAAVLALMENFLIVSGGPGTGKSTVIHYVIRAVLEYYNIPVDEIVVCAPTGRAKARLLDTITRGIEPDDPFATIEAKTIHSLLGISDDGFSRYSGEKKLPYRLVVVDEVSMVDLRLFANLVEALLPSCRIVLVGDMEQLPPIDAGGVLGDLTAELSDEEKLYSLTPERLDQIKKIISLSGAKFIPDESAALKTKLKTPLANHLITLTRNYRSDQSILKWWEDRTTGVVNKSRLSDNKSDKPAVEYIGSSVFKFRSSAEVILKKIYASWIEEWSNENGVYGIWRDKLREKLKNIQRGDSLLTAEELIAIIEKQRILCCIHEGTFGRIAANELCDRLFWQIKGNTGKPPKWHDGQPIIVNSNQVTLDLYNGDLGVVLEEKDRCFGCFAIRNRVMVVPIELIRNIEKAYAVSVHKSQGSEFNEIMLVIPDVSVMQITRPLVYTAITRARRKVCIIDPADKLSDIRTLPTTKRAGILKDIIEKNLF